MQRAPPVDRLINNGNVDKADDSKNCGGSRALMSAAHVAAQHQVANVDEPQDQGCGQACIPCPPCAPCGLAPDGAGDECQRDEDGSKFGRGTRSPVPAFIFLPQVTDTSKGDYSESQHADPGYRHMEVED